MHKRTKQKCDGIKTALRKSIAINKVAHTKPHGGCTGISQSTAAVPLSLSELFREFYHHV